MTFADLKLGAKLLVIILFVVSVVFAGFVAATSYSLDKDRRERAGELAKSFQARLVGSFELDPTPTDHNGQPMPSLKLDGKVIDLDVA